MSDTHVRDDLVKGDSHKCSGGLGSASGDEDVDDGEDADDVDDDSNPDAVTCQLSSGRAGEAVTGIFEVCPLPELPEQWMMRQRILLLATPEVSPGSSSPAATARKCHCPIVMERERETKVPCLGGEDLVGTLTNDARGTSICHGSRYVDASSSEKS